MPVSDPFINALAELLIPKKRDRGIKVLMESGAIGQESAATLRDELDKPSYNDRGMGMKIVSPKLIVDNYVSGHRFSPLSPEKGRQQILRWKVDSDAALGDSAFSLESLAGSTVVDFGSGRQNTLNIPVMLFANGAERVFAVEPGRIDGASALNSLRELVGAMIFDPGRFNFSGIEDMELKTRAASLDLERTATMPTIPIVSNLDLGGVTFVNSIDAIPDGSTDLVLSCSVLEHVLSLASEVQEWRRIGKTDSIGIHTVDFTDHAKLTVPFDPFAFYYRDPSSLNELRPVDMKHIMTEGGFSVEETGMVDADPSVVNVDRLHRRFAEYALEDLVRRQSTFVLRKNAGATVPAVG